MDETVREVARLWTLAQPAVSAFVASMVRDFRDRDDLLQDVAVAVLDSYATYNPSRPFVAWARGLPETRCSCTCGARDATASDDRARRLCELRYRDDLRPAAIAAEVGMSSNAVAMALQRIREALRDCVARKAAFDGA